MKFQLFVFIVTLFFGASIAFEFVAATNSPFGVGLPEANPRIGGPFGSFFAWVATQQSYFYRALTESISDFKSDGIFAWGLIVLSFSYGIFHAVGPGHGKAIISSYVLADGETLRRGISLSMASAMAQAITAILLVSILAVLLNLTSIVITETTRIFEIGSYLLITAIGVWLMWQKLLKQIYSNLFNRLSNGIQNSNKKTKLDQQTTTHSHSCDHHHYPDPSNLSGAMSISRIWSVILAIGLRPCTGALIVLVFAFSQGVYWVGIFSTFAMGIGTGITVAILASLAVGSRGMAIKIFGSNSASYVHRGIEIIGALLVFFIGLTLLIVALGNF